MNDFFDLESSQVLKDRLNFYVFSELITQLYNLKEIDRTQTYRYSTQMETEETRQMILDNWNVLCFFGSYGELEKKHKHMIFWVLDHAINYLNEHYQFEHPLIFEHHRIVQQTAPRSGKTTTITYYDFKFM